MKNIRLSLMKINFKPLFLESIIDSVNNNFNSRIWIFLWLSYKYIEEISTRTNVKTTKKY